MVDASHVYVLGLIYTPSIAFRHLPPNTARFGYATEEALFISAQLSTNTVSALQKVWLLIRLRKQPSMRRIHHGYKKKSSVSIQTIVVLFMLV